jgi:hypothetical protein
MSFFRVAFFLFRPGQAGVAVYGDHFYFPMFIDQK